MNSKVSIVVIDDNPAILEMLSAALGRAEVDIFTAQDAETGIELVHREHPQVVITDLVMPGGSGLDVLDRVVGFDSSIDVILLTAHHSSESAVEAIRRGAADYLTKPVPLSLLRDRVSQLVEAERSRQALSALDEDLLKVSTFEGMIGRSPAMWEMFSRIRRVAPYYQMVLIGGDTGSGKELVARALHNLSPARNGHFVVLNCSAVVETLFESELFGHVRGSFTGATHDKMGLFEYADKGTLFLDEIGDMPLATQAKLLRALQNREIQRIGSMMPRPVNVRVIAATHRDLRAAIAAKQFREDLYYRLSMVEIGTPPLASRKEDLPLLTKYFVDRFASQYGREIRGLTQRAKIVLARHNWPGNVRELENAIGHACMMTLAATIDVQDLPEYLHAPGRLSEDHGSAAAGPGATGFDEHEKRLIADALVRAKGNQSEAARALRIGRDSLRYKVKKHGLQSEQSQPSSQAKTAETGT